MSINIVVAGATGRMGREVIAAAADQSDLAVIGGLVRPRANGGTEGTSSEQSGYSARAAVPATSASGPNSTAGDSAWRQIAGLNVPVAAIDRRSRGLLDGVGAVIDFSTPTGAVTYARACASAGVPFVSGTTGLSEQDMAELRSASQQIPVFYARNMSLGIATLLAVLPQIAAALSGFDIEIVETHHRHKVDAPSGTALALGEVIASSLPGATSAAFTHGREGLAPRRPGEIGFHAVRAGGNPGEHQIIFASEGEEVRLSHRSFSRRAYAEGALRAAAFVAGRQPGFYGLDDLLRG
jgi:4-hydroxy-tetrahydrodipicolinate reductase